MTGVARVVCRRGELGVVVAGVVTESVLVVVEVVLILLIVVVVVMIVLVGVVAITTE